jgi:hypothetical protein
MMPGSAPDLIQHLERHVGALEVGWTKDANGKTMPFQVGRFRVRGEPGVTFSTIGLSRSGLRSRVSEKLIHQELVMRVPVQFIESGVTAILQQVGGEALSNGTAYLRGDVVGPRGPIVERSRLEALYVSIPVYFPESFGQLDLEDRTIVFAWLVPISANEAAYVRSMGWDAFEKRLVELDPDLIDLERSPLPL